MRVPYIKQIWDTTPVTIHLTDGLDETGAPLETAVYTGKCNFSETAKTARQSDGTLVHLTAGLTIGGDIAPGVPVLSGSAEINGRTWQITSASRARNPDGTVHHTSLGLT